MNVRLRKIVKRLARKRLKKWPGKQFLETIPGIEDGIIPMPGKKEVRLPASIPT
jgi:hypothetical protein